MSNNRQNGEHPKPGIELLEDSLTIANVLSTQLRLSLEETLMLLIFNELRCLHFHFDVGVVTRQFLEEVKEEKKR